MHCVLFVQYILVSQSQPHSLLYICTKKSSAYINQSVCGGAISRGVANLPNVQHLGNKPGIIQLVDIVLLMRMVSLDQAVQSTKGQQADTVSCQLPQTP